MKLHPTVENPLPPGAECLELVTADKVRLRAMRALPEEACGTVILLGGRGDFMERYFETTRDILARGLAVASVDLRPGVPRRNEPIRPEGSGLRRILKGKALRRALTPRHVRQTMILT